MSSHDPPYQLTQPGTPMTTTSLPGDPTVNHPCYLTPGISTEIIQNASTNMTDSWTTISSLNQPYQPLQPRAPATVANILNDPPQDLPGYLTPRIDTERVLSRQTTSANVTNSWTIVNSLDPQYQLMQLRSPNVTDSWTTESFLHPPYQPTYQRTPATTTSLLGASAQNNLGHLTPGTSTKSILCQQKPSSNVTDSCHVLNARTTMSYLNTQCEPTQPMTPATAFSFLNDPAINSRSYSTLLTGTRGILGDQKTSANATDSRTTVSFVAPSYKPTQSRNPARTASLLGDSSHGQYLAPRTSTESIRGHHKIDSWDTMTSCDPPHQPLAQRAPAAAADMHGSLSHPHTRNQTRSGIILCLPAQQTPAKTNNMLPIPTTRPPKNLTSPSQISATTRPPKNLTSPSQISGSLTMKHESRSATFWTSCLRCRMRYEYMNIFLNQQLLCGKCNLPFMAIKMPAPSPGVLESLSDDALPQNITSFTGNIDAASVFNVGTSGLEGEGTIRKRRSGSKRVIPRGNLVGSRGVPCQRNTPRRLRELPREEIRHMLMDKARAEITRYLDNLKIAESSSRNMEKMEE